MNEGPRPQPFRVGTTLFVRISGVGLCRMGSWGWERCTEGLLEAARTVEENRKGEEE